jgi:tetratricopeptide (TPR) repeat protein
MPPILRSTWCRPWLGLGLLLGLAALPRALQAQDDPRLVNVVRIAQEGQTDSAQQVLNGILATTSPNDSLFPQLLYTQGIIARTLDDRRRAFARITVEYANSSWADDALVQLALLDYAAGNRDEAARKFTRLKTDYPGSPLMVKASYWAARDLFELHRQQEACTWVNDGLAAAGDDIETKNQLNWLSGRCGAAMAQDSTRTDSNAPPSASSPAPPSGAGTAGGTKPPAGGRPARRTGVGVQVGAVGTQADADRLAGNLTAAGFQSYVVKEGKLFKVRAGPYPDRAAAVAALPSIKKAMGGSPFLVKEP